MSLINCPECGKEISDKAEMCPNCGCPQSEFYSSIVRELPPEEQPEMEPCYGCGIMIPTNIAVCLFCNYNYGKCREWGQLTQPKEERVWQSRERDERNVVAEQESTFLPPKKSKLKCPRCKSGNVEFMYAEEAGARDAVIKKTTSLNINPFKPLTIFNHNEKVIKKAKEGYIIKKWHCLDCGKIFNR